jgi:hypothetical protein
LRQKLNLGKKFDYNGKLNYDERKLNKLSYQSAPEFTHLIARSPSVI